MSGYYSLEQYTVKTLSRLAVSFYSKKKKNASNEQSVRINFNVLTQRIKCIKMFNFGLCDTCTGYRANLGALKLLERIFGLIS